MPCLPPQFYVRRNQWVFWTAWALAIGLLLVISCVEKARRSFPTNMLLLAAFTAVQAFLVGTLTAFYNIEAVAIAFAVTAAVVVAITIFAINTKIDVTRWGTMLLVALVAFIVLLIIGMFWVNKILYLVLSGIACLLFSAYLVSGCGPAGQALVWMGGRAAAACSGALMSIGATFWGAEAACMAALLNCADFALGKPLAQGSPTCIQPLRACCADTLLLLLPFCPHLASSGTSSCMTFRCVPAVRIWC